MSLADEYRRQQRWRDWPTILDALPPVEGRTVLDLGCGEGGVAAELVGRGARVIGVDLNDDLLRAARARGLAGAEFRSADLRTLDDLELDDAVAGLWSSFAPAYFPDLAPVLASWRAHLQPGGWAALTEVDDLFGHEPLAPRTKSLLEAYARELLEAGWYDFHMGRKLAGHLERAGFTVSKTFTVEDRELAFDGPADPDVLEAWRRRLDRMKGLQDFCGEEFEGVREDLLGCLGRTDHRSSAKVVCCIATG
ncbi:MAG TPA: methyltransferase domain-containing protein [Longimicrobiales bacterium]|nr:methyltransferase domain-containing protein [Longimicrobiales bacterium]